MSLSKPVNFNECSIENGIQFVFSSKTGNDFWNKDFETGRRSITECCTCWGKIFFWRLSLKTQKTFLNWTFSPVLEPVVDIASSQCSPRKSWRTPSGMVAGSVGFEKCLFKSEFKKQPCKLWTIRTPGWRTPGPVQRVVVRGEHDRDIERR